MAEEEFAKTSREVRYRRHFGLLLNARGAMHGLAVEIGTDRGDFAVGFLDTWRGATLLCVDPWKDYPEMKQPRQPDYDVTIQRLAPYGARVRIWRGTSMDAVKAELSGVPVFVYIDGEHTTKAVTEDCEAWWERLDKKVGILAGHDWEAPPPVRPAVIAFAKKVGRTIWTVRDIEKGRSWYMYKNPDTIPFDFDVGGWVGRQGVN